MIFISNCGKFEEPSQYQIAECRKKIYEASFYPLAKIVHCKIAPHIFRHTFAIMLPENNDDFCCIQVLLGPSSIRKAQICLHLSNTSVHAALNQANFQNRLNSKFLCLFAPLCTIYFKKGICLRIQCIADRKWIEALGK